MAKHEQQSKFSGFLSPAAEGEQPESLFRFQNPEAFDFLVHELLHIHDDTTELSIYADDRTAATDEFRAALRPRHTVTVCGGPDGAPAIAGDNVLWHEISKTSAAGRFLIVLSGPMVSAVIQDPGAGPEAPIAGGGCTFDPNTVKALLVGLGISPESACNGFSWPAGDSLPAPAAQILNRLLAHSETSRTNAAIAQNDLSKILEILKSLSVRRRTHDILYIFVEQIAANVNVHRCSVVRIWEGDSEAHVLASHEDETVNDVVIQLDKYPEVGNTLRTAEKTVVNNVQESAVMAPVAAELKNAGIASILVVPIVLFNPNVGSFLLRAARKNGTFNQREIEFCQIVAETAANAIERADLLETLQKTNRRLEHLAVTDSLTGLYNRRFLLARLNDEYARAMRYGSPLSCMLLDIDDFKSVNDTYGHLQGDLVLQELTRRTLHAVRTNDIVARYGGEELVVILPETELDGALMHAQRLLETVAEGGYAGLPENRTITVSIGVSTLDRERCKSPEELIRLADEGLYAAKEAGKNCIKVGEYS